MTYRIIAHRSAASIFGAASAPVKVNGEILEFADRTEAEAECARINRSRVSYNVDYTVQEV